MTLSAQFFKIPGFSDYSSLVHGFSGRRLYSLKNEKEKVSLGNNGSPLNAEYLKAFLHSLNISGRNVFLLTQIHGDKVFVLDDPNKTPENILAERADAIVTPLEQKPIAILTADCIPILIYEIRKNVIGAVHAGRKGTAKNILSKTVNLLKSKYLSKSKDILIGLGPGIGGCCYEVEANCLGDIRTNYQKSEMFIRPAGNGKFFLDLLQANIMDAQATGIPDQNIFNLNRCTACEIESFYSYRREGAAAGRNISLIMLNQPAT